MSYQLAYTRLLVSRFQECFRFYRDVLGLKATYGEEDGSYADFEAGSTTLALFERQLMAEAIGSTGLPSHVECQDRAALIFLVPDVDKAYEQLQQKGVPFITQPTDRTDWGIRTAHFRDPDGNLLEIYAALRS
jgi:catechol 2,3-dioxygenase-like lactoylglutathione lyase family enzyme